MSQGPTLPALLAYYCKPTPRFQWTEQTREDSRVYSGPCGFDGRRGYDDGYDWMAALEAAGWRTIDTLGEMPFSIYFDWRALPADPRHAIAHYCEGDLSIEVFTDRAAAERAVYQKHHGHPAD